MSLILGQINCGGIDDYRLSVRFRFEWAAAYSSSYALLLTCARQGRVLTPMQAKFS